MPVDWLAGEPELISIMPKKVANERIVMDETQKAMAFVGLVLLLPALPADAPAGPVGYARTLQ